MSALSNYAENSLIDHLLRGRSYSAPTTLYFALYTTAPDDATGGTEVSGSNYSRASTTPSDTSFTNTQGTTSGASSGTGGTVTNGELIQFATPSGTWGTVVGMRVLDQSGNPLLYGSVPPRLINASDDVKFAIGSISFQIDN